MHHAIVKWLINVSTSRTGDQEPNHDKAARDWLLGRFVFRSFDNIEAALNLLTIEFSAQLLSL